MTRPLLSSNDLRIRDGVGAMLAQELDTLDAKQDPINPPHWTEYQIAEQELRDQLAGIRDELAPYRDPVARKQARDAFDAYAYQWY